MKDKVYLAIEFVAIAAALVAYVWWDVSTSRAILSNWADREDLAILESSHRNLFRGPFTWNSRYHCVFRIKARDKNGRIRTGWVKLKHYAFVPVEVVWAD